MTGSSPSDSALPVPSPARLPSSVHHPCAPALSLSPLPTPAQTEQPASPTLPLLSPGSWLWFLLPCLSSLLYHLLCLSFLFFRVDVFYALLDALLFILHSHNSLVGLTVISISVVMIVFIGFASYIYFFTILSCCWCLVCYLWTPGRVDDCSRADLVAFDLGCIWYCFCCALYNCVPKTWATNTIWRLNEGWIETPRYYHL